MGWEAGMRFARWNSSTSVNLDEVVAVELHRDADLVEVRAFDASASALLGCDPTLAERFVARLADAGFVEVGAGRWLNPQRVFSVTREGDRLAVQAWAGGRPRSFEAPDPKCVLERRLTGSVCDADEGPCTCGRWH